MSAYWPAIARIMVGDERGTGFLVSSDGLVLTALHVVASEWSEDGGETFTPRDGAIEVSFGDPENKATQWAPDQPAAIVEGCFSVADDWVLLKVTAAPARVRPLRLASYKGALLGGEFKTFGFPGSEADIGGSYTGHILNWDGRVELDSAQIFGGAVLGGISGAPCIVAGFVVAMIVKAPVDADRGAWKPGLRGVSVERIVKGKGHMLPWEDHQELHFEPDVISALPPEADLLVRGQEQLDLNEDQASKRAVVARALLRAELRRARTALQRMSIGPEPSAAIVEAVAAMKLPHEGVARFATAASDRRPALLATRDARVITWYLQRAGAITQKISRHWTDRTLWIADRTSKPGEEESATGDDAIVTMVSEAIKGLGKPSARKVYTKRFEGKRREGDEFCVVVRGGRRLDRVLVACERLPNAHFVVATPDLDPNHHSERVEQIAPMLESDAEEALRDELAEADSIFDREFEDPYETR